MRKKVARILTYDGDEKWVDMTISNSFPVGVNRIGGSGTITVVQQSGFNLAEDSGNMTVVAVAEQPLVPAERNYYWILETERSTVPTMARYRYGLYHTWGMPTKEGTGITPFKVIAHIHNPDTRFEDGPNE
jgi:hypothetical protein